MGLGARVHEHKAKPKKDTNDYTFRYMQNPVTPEEHKSMTSHFGVIKKFDQRTQNQGNIDSDKQTQVIKNSYKKKLENIKS